MWRKTPINHQTKPFCFYLLLVGGIIFKLMTVDIFGKSACFLTPLCWITTQSTGRDDELGMLISRLLFHFKRSHLVIVFTPLLFGFYFREKNRGPSKSHDKDIHVCSPRTRDHSGYKPTCTRILYGLLDLQNSLDVSSGDHLFVSKPLRNKNHTPSSRWRSIRLVGWKVSWNMLNKTNGHFSFRWVDIHGSLETILSLNGGGGVTVKMCLKTKLLLRWVLLGVNLFFVDKQYEKRQENYIFNKMIFKKNQYIYQMWLGYAWFIHRMQSRNKLSIVFVGRFTFKLALWNSKILFGIIVLNNETNVLILFINYFHVTIATRNFFNCVSLPNY